MKKIDRETVQRILDAADIVEVVSDFVSLKKRGSNYIGLCPFHNERTPSFSVSRAKGICKCFSCGKSGSAVGFIMEHEQMSFYEALRYLAKKYHIEIKEHEMTDEERAEATERESMLAVNDFALEHFRYNLTGTADGRDIGLAYFRERGINDLMIEKFRLGYSLDRSDDLYKAATAKGYDEKYLLDTGLCAKSENNGRIYDKFRGRVVYPLFSVSGRVVAFGARTLRSDKNVAKYMNSPQSLIYNKSREVYGLYQAKSGISKREKCILVEGYMDVISMHQIGIDNVVASCGTSLTEGQIRLIHRFTDNVTLIYDADAAGVKASLRGIDLLLAEGMNIKVLHLPDGEDPDSFAQSHSAAEVEEYINTHEVDFIRFKTAILLKDAQADPITRARVINDILASISVIPDAILRTEYVKECSRMLEISEDTLMLQLQRLIADNAAKKQRRTGETTAEQPSDPAAGQPPRQFGPIQPGPGPQTGQQVRQPVRADEKIRRCEAELMKYIVKYGMAALSGADEAQPVTVLGYVYDELQADGITITDPVLARIFDTAVEIASTQWVSDLETQQHRFDADYDEALKRGRSEILDNAKDLSEIQTLERRLQEACDADYAGWMDNYAVSYLVSRLLSSPDDVVRKASTDLAYEKYVLSKVHTRFSRVESERERLAELVPRAVLELKLAILNGRIEDIFNEIKSHSNDPYVVSLLQEQKRLFEIRSEFSKYLGERIVSPR